MTVPGWVARASAVAALVPIAVLVVLGVRAPWSLSGWLALAAFALAAAAGLFSAPRVRRLRGVAAASLLALLIVRLLAPSGGSTLRTLPGATSSRWLGRVFDEQDVSLLGARALTWRWPMIPEERDGLVREMRDAYVEMRRDAGASPSPVVNTLLGRQTPRGFDAIVFEPPQAVSGAAVVFLHGYGGSFRLECWLVARAARAIGATTVCPATGFAGRWGGANGERIVRATLDYLHGRGIERVYLAGLSNGAVGASALAPKLAASLAGLILISGAPAAGANAGLPTLVIHGERDPMASARAARAFATHARGNYAGFDAGHFVLLTRREDTRASITDWLRRWEAAPAAR